MSEDLIKRSDAVIVVYKALRTPPLKGVLTDTVPLAIELVHGIPSADRPSGEWICKDSADMSVYWFECSECGEKTPRDNFNREYKSNYCPNCGAKMGGK